MDMLYTLRKAQTVLVGTPLVKIMLESGWNWISIPTLKPHVDVSALTHSGGFADGDYLVGIDGSMTYNQTFGGWFGESSPTIGMGRGLKMWVENEGYLTIE